jgi:hypothetical protein
MAKASQLFLCRLADCGRTVADIHAADAAREIEKHIPIYVVQSGTFSPRNEDWHGRVRPSR